MAIKKERLDKRVQDTYPQLSRTHIQSLIMQGKVSVDGQVITKAGHPTTLEAIVLVQDEQPPYVCRAGVKLAHALDYFSINPEGLVVLDAGLSTGGFTDCLLQRGAQKVYGVDVGYGQVHEKIAHDPRVCVMERTNLRNVTELPERVDLVTLDLSFISLTKIIPVITTLLKPHGACVALIKPQFEARREQVGRGGIVKDSAVHQEVIERVTSAFQEAGFTCKGVTPSPITGTSGNVEFLGYFVR